MKLSQFKFKLTEEQIAKYPAKNRDESRLMVVHRNTGEIEHRIFKDILEYFDDKDVFVFNYYFFYFSYLLVRLLHHLHQHCQILNQNYLNELDLILLQNHRHLQM